MKKPFGNKNKRPFAPSDRPYQKGPREFGARRDDADRPDRGPRNFDRDDRGPRHFDRDDRGSRDFGRDNRGPGDRPFKPAWKKDRPGFGGPREGGDRPAWKKDRPSFGGGSREGGDRPAWKKDRPSFDRPSFGGGSREGGDRPAWKKDRPGFAPRDTGDRPAWKKDRPAFSAGAGKPAWKRDRPDFTSPSERPAWKKDRPSYNPGPGGKPRKSYQPGGYQGNAYSDRPQRDFRHERDDERPAYRPHGGGGGYKPDRPAWKQGGEKKHFNAPDKPRYDGFNPRETAPEPEYQQSGPSFDKSGRERVSVPFNKVNRPIEEAPAPRKAVPFDPGFVPNAPTAKALVVTLEDTNNVPTRIVWVYDTMVGQLPDGDPAAGTTVFVYDDRNRFLGSAIYNPHSRIRARIFSLTRKRFDQEYIREALATAVQRRKTLGLLTDSCRVVFGESDGLPGLIADKIGSYLVIQPLTFAVNQHLPFIIDRLNELVAPDGIVVRKDVPIRAKEGLAVEAPEVHGDVPEQVPVKEAGITTFANITGGQKTGLFLDQRFNREVIKPFCTAESSVLDLFCHVGGWALRAARYGAAEVIGVDSSRSSLDLAEAGAAASGLTEKVTFAEDDVFEYLRNIEAGKLFDVIVVDPPAFAKTRQHYEEAFRAYLSLNYLAMKKLKPGGLLVTCSCSQALSITEFNEAILTAARNARMQFQVLERRGAPADHPVLLGLPETEYLKCFVLARTE